MNNNEKTFADFEQDAEQLIKQIANFDAATLTTRIERLTEWLEHFVSTAVFESDDTVFGAQWSIITLHKLLVALGGRLVQIESTVTEDSELTSLVPRLSLAFSRLSVRVDKFCNAFKQFENLTVGLKN